jgi:hypothetical protein
LAICGQVVAGVMRGDRSEDRHVLQIGVQVLLHPRLVEVKPVWKKQKKNQSKSFI